MINQHTADPEATRDIQTIDVMTEATSKKTTQRLTPFERYMVAEDRASYPMAFAFCVECTGQVDRSRLQSSFDHALQKQPLLIARLRKGVFSSHWYWEPFEGRSILWHEDGADARQMINRSPDLDSGVGVELHVAVTREVSKLIFNFHHATCDGLGALQFIESVLVEYELRSNDEQPAEADFDFARRRLEGRGQFVTPCPTPLTRKQIVSGLLRESSKVVLRRPQPIPVTRRPEADSESPETGVHLFSLPQSISDQLSKLARRRDVTLNDLLVRDLFLTLRKWFRDHGHTKSGDWVRVLVPTNLRDESMKDMPAANVLGYAMITRRLEECDSDDELLAAISADMTAVRDWGLGSLFVKALSIVDRVPGLLFAICRCSRRFSTMILSNLGNLGRLLGQTLPTDGEQLQAGNLTIENVWAIPPVRPGTRASLVVCRYGGRICFSMRVDSRWLTDDDARELAGKYCARLEETVAGKIEYSDTEALHVSSESDQVDVSDSTKRGAFEK